MFDWVIAPQSTTTLYIYRVGRSWPCRSWKPNKSRAKIQLRLGLQCPYLVKPPRPRGLPPLWRGDLPKAISLSSGLRIGRSIYESWSTRRDLSNGEAQITFWGLWLGRSNRVSPDLHFLVSTYALCFLVNCVLKDNSKVDVTFSTGHFVLRAILIEIGHIFSIVFKIHALWRGTVINKLLVVF
jgi:hypothetical protein